MEICTKFDEKSIIWSTLDADAYNQLKKQLKPAKKKNLHTNNLTVFNFEPGNWLEYKSKWSTDERYIVLNKKDVLYGYHVKELVHQNKKLGDQDPNRQIRCLALVNIRAKFKELENAGFKTCFGTVDDKILRCVPKQFYWSKNEPYFGFVSSVDFSSHYPACLCGDLPDSHTAIEMPGTVKPNKEYKFAFYIKSGHLAIYKEFDTHDWETNLQFGLTDLFRFRSYRTYDDTYKVVKPKNDVTILMKAADKKLDAVIKYFYDRKSYDTEAKLTLNAAIGQMHRKKYDRDKFAHLAAVAIARANNKMLNLVSNVKKSDIIQIQVDGIIYKGDKKLGIDTKYLGAPVQEVLNKECRWERIGAYMIKMNDTEYKIKCQGYNSMTDGRKPEESNCFEDMNLWEIIKE